MQNDSPDFENKPTSNKDMWLFLIILDVVFLCVFGFFLYKHFSGQVLDKPATPAIQTTQVEETLPVVEEEPVPPAVQPVEEVATEVVMEEPVQVEQVPPAQPQESTSAVPAKQSIVVASTNGKYRRVTFRWFGEGERVAIVSGFTMSKPQALKKTGDHWETTLSIAPGTYKFLYIIDGKNTLDPYADEKDGRSVIVVK